MGTDTVSSDALLLLLETVNKQASQIKRLESLVAGADTFSSYDTSTHRRGGDDRTHKQLQQLQNSVQALEQQHVASCSTNKALSEQLQRVEQRVQQLEAQNQVLQQQGQQLQQQLVGSPAHSKAAGLAPHKPTHSVYASILGGGPSTADETGPAQAVPAGLPGGRSMAARLSKLEQQVEALASTAASAEEKLLSATTTVQALDDDVSKQLHNIRADVKQAITVAGSSVRKDLEASAQARRQQDAAQLKEQLKGLMTELDGLLASSQRTLAASLTAEAERRTAAAQEATEGRLAALRVQLDRLEEEKADITLVTQYTGQVADVFEQLATTVADSTQASIAQLMSQQQELRGAVASLSASKADGATLLQHQQHCQQQLLELQRGLAAAQAAASEAAVAAAVAKAALEPVDALRLQLAETQGAVAALQATAAGMEAAASSTSSEQQQQAQQLQQLAGSQHMLQQQLMALTNHVDPAAATQLAAAAAGDESALNFQPLGPLASGCGSLASNPVFESLNGGAAGGAWEEAWATGSYLQCSSQAGATRQGPAPSAPGGSAGQDPSSEQAASGGGTAQGAAGGPGSSSGSGVQEQLRPVAADAAGPSATSGASSIGTSSTGQMTPGSRTAAAGRGFADRMGAVLRHLPVAVRLLRLETAVRDLHNAIMQKAPAGEVQGMQQQLERLVAGLTQLEGVSTGSMRHLEEQSATLAAAVAALGDSLDERPTLVQVQDVAGAASHAAAEPLQQQLGGLTAELDAVQARLRRAGQDLQHLKDWQAQAAKQVEALQGAEQAVRQEGQQLQQQVAAELSRQQQEVQQLLTRHSAEVAWDTIKQFRADQEASQGGAADAVARVASLESKLKVVVAEVDRMQEQAALTARVQDKHTDMTAALEAALSAQSSKYATVSQQLRLELREALAKAKQAQSAKTAALEASLKDQSGALAGLAVAVAKLPSKGGLLEAALKSAKVAVEELLAKHKQQEEGRWEVWLAEFARAIEQRPTAAQLQKQLAAAQQAAVDNAQEAAVQRMQCVTAGVEAGLMQRLRGLQLQLEQLRGRTRVLEDGTGIGSGYADPFDAGGPDSPLRSQLFAERAEQARGAAAAAAGKEGLPAKGAAGPNNSTTPARPAQHTAGAYDTAQQVAEADAHTVSVAAIVAAFEGSPAPAEHRVTPARPLAAAPTPPQQGPAARAAVAAAAQPDEEQGLCAPAADPAAAGVQWRELPVASSVLAEATGAAAAKAAAASPFGDSSVVGVRRDGSSSSSEVTVEASSTHSGGEDGPCGGGGATPPALATRTALQLPAGADAAAGVGGMQPCLSVEESSASGPAAAAAEATVLLRALQAAAADSTAQGSVASHATAGETSPSVRSLSPELLVACTSAGSCSTSRPQAAPAAAAGAMQAHHGAHPRPAHLGLGGGGSTSSRRGMPGRPVGAGQLGTVQGSCPLPPGAAASNGGTEAADCTSELQQLLDLQQQVQQCLVDSGCVPVGRRARPPKDRHHKKGHKRTRVHSKEGSAAGAPTGSSPAPAAAAAGTAGTPQQEEEEEEDEAAVAATSPAQATSGLSVDDAIAAAAAALADRPRLPAAAAATPPSGAGVGAAFQQQRQRVQAQEEGALQLAAAPLPPPCQPATRPSRSQEIRSLLTLQQQLAQCLREHGCFLEQHPQRQQQQQLWQAEPFMAAAGGSSIAGLQQQQQQEEAVAGGGMQQQQQGQRYSVQEVELEQLLVLQAQMQQAVRH